MLQSRRKIYQSILTGFMNADILAAKRLERKYELVWQHNSLDRNPSRYYFTVNYDYILLDQSIFREIQRHFGIVSKEFYTSTYMLFCSVTPILSTWLKTFEYFFSEKNVKNSYLQIDIITDLGHQNQSHKKLCLLLSYQLLRMVDVLNILVSSTA